MRLPALPKNEEKKEDKPSRLTLLREAVTKKINVKKPFFKVPKRK